MISQGGRAVGRVRSCRGVSVRFFVATGPIHRVLNNGECRRGDHPPPGGSYSSPPVADEARRVAFALHYLQPGGPSLHFSIQVLRT